MKKKKTNIVSEEIISEDFQEFDEFVSDSSSGNSFESASPVKKKSKNTPIITIAIIAVLLVVVGVLGFLVFQKFAGNNKQVQSSIVVEEEPDAPFVSVSTTPSPTESLPTTTPTVTTEPEPTLEPTPEISEIPESTEEVDLEKQESSLDMESLENSLILEEDSDKTNIDDKYKEVTVYYTEDLKTFHKKDCAVIKDKNKIKTTAFGALFNDYEACEKCNPLGNSKLDNLSTAELDALNKFVVYKTASNTKYHTKDCSILKNAGIETNLKDAIENNLEACSLCNPRTIENYDEEVVTPTKKPTDKTDKITPTKKPTATITPTKTAGSGNSTIITPTVTKVPTITKVPVALISVTGGTVKVGETLPLYVSFLPTNAVSTITFKISDTDIAIISSNATVTGLKPGKVTITVSADNGVSSSCVVEVVDGTTTPTPIVTTTPSQTPTVPTPNYTDTTLDLNNLGLTGISKFVYPSNINLIDMEAMSDWESFMYKISSNGGELVTTSSGISLSVGGVTRLQLYKYDDNIWALRVYDSLETTLNKCTLKAMCTKISSMPDTLYTNIYEDFEVREFIGERYRSIGDASIKSEVSGGSTTYYIKDVNYEY